MTPEEKELLQKIFELSQDNNIILHKMNKRAVVASVFQFLYWALIIGLTFGAFYFIQPYMNSLMSSLGGESNVSGPSYNTLLENLKTLNQIN